MNPPFAPVPNSKKIMCVVCGATGYEVAHHRSWMNAHERGHSPCPGCGKMLTRLQNGRPRTHSRCPARLATPYRKDTP